jgi:hypothetical protein
VKLRERRRLLDETDRVEEVDETDRANEADETAVSVPSGAGHTAHN